MKPRQNVSWKSHVREPQELQSHIISESASAQPPVSGADKSQDQNLGRRVWISVLGIKTLLFGILTSQHSDDAWKTTLKHIWRIKCVAGTQDSLTMTQSEQQHSPDRPPGGSWLILRTERNIEMKKLPTFVKKPKGKISASDYLIQTIEFSVFVSFL